MKKRLLATILSLCLLVGLLPTAALAAETDGDILDVQEQSGGQENLVAPVRELPTENAMCTYVGNDGTQSAEEVTLSAAVEALNDAGGGTITVVSSGLADEKNIQIDTPITIVAQEEKPVVVTTPAMEEDNALFLIRQYGAENSVLTLGKDGMSDGLLTFDGAGQDNTCIVGNVAGNGDADKPHGVVLQDSVVLTGCTVSAIASGSQRIPQVTMYGGQIKGNTGKYAVMGSPFTMTGGEIWDNKSEEATICVPFFDSTTRIGGDARIYDNEAGSYGGVFTRGSLILENNATISKCKAVDDDGFVGGVSAAGTLTMRDNALIELCSAAQTGGAAAGDVTMSGSAAIRHCTATKAGLESGKIIVSSAGGMVCAGNASIGSDAGIYDCTGGLSGGILCTGAWNYIGKDDAATVKIEGTIRDNSGAVGGGIGVMLSTNLVIEVGAEIVWNTATAVGGGIALLNAADASQNDGGIEDYQKVTLTMNGGTISRNTAPRGSGVYVAGIAEVDEFDTKEVAQRVPCYVNLNGGSITENTATESDGGGMFLGWDTESTIQGAVNISGNWDGTGAASDLYLRQDPDVPVSDPGSGDLSNSIEGLKNFIQTSAKTYVEEEVWPDMAEELDTDEEVKEALSELGISTEGLDLTLPELVQLLHETVLKVYSLQFQITLMETFIYLYRQEHAFVPTPEEFYPLWSGLMLEYYEVLLPIEIAGASKEDINEIAEAIGLIEEGGNYTGTTEDLIDAYMKFLKTQIPTVDSKDYQDVYSEYWNTPVSGGGADFPFDARLNVTGPLAGSSICVNVENPQQWRVIAEGTDTYPISDEDLAVFQSNDSPYQVVRADGNKNLLVLSEKEDPGTDPTPDPGPTPGGDTSGGSSSGSTTYPITVEDSRNGEAESNRHRAERGDTVTITVDPDRGYELDELIVTDKNGDEIEVRRLSNGKYTFTMPRSAVTVEAVFTAAAAEGTFADVSPDAYYADAVEWAVANGITGGTTATTFSPNNPCTRAHAVTFLWRAAGEPEPETTAMPFTDVAEGAYYYDAVLWAMENGITEGTTETTFSPDAPCTRAQIVTFLWRSEGKPAPQSAMGFTDVAAGAYYFDAVAWAVENGITNGTTTTTFSPSSSCTRAQIVTFLYRYMA